MSQICGGFKCRKFAVEQPNDVLCSRAGHTEQRDKTTAGHMVGRGPNSMKTLPNARFSASWAWMVWVVDAIPAW
eukprot:364946-Chlamydomonas_euryale.AAC.7